MIKGEPQKHTEFKEFATPFKQVAISKALSLKNDLGVTTYVFRQERNSGTRYLVTDSSDKDGKLVKKYSSK